MSGIFPVLRPSKHVIVKGELVSVCNFPSPLCSLDITSIMWTYYCITISWFSCWKQEENGYHRQFVSCTPASLRDHVLHPKANHQPKQSTTTTNSLSLDSIAASQVRVTLSVYAILQHKTGNSLTLAQQTSRLKASCEGGGQPTRVRTSTSVSLVSE